MLTYLIAYTDAPKPHWSEAEDSQIACIEVEFYSAVVTHYYTLQPTAPDIEPSMAEPVHKDSKVNTLVGLQVKDAGCTEAQHEFSAAKLDILPGARRRFARFFYRTKPYLNAFLEQDAVELEQLDVKQRPRRDSLNPDNYKKPRGIARSPQAGAPAAPAESSEQRKKRVREQYRTVDPATIVDLDAPPPPRVVVDIDTAEETIEEAHRDDESNAAAIEPGAAPDAPAVGPSGPTVKKADDDDAPPPAKRLRGERVEDAIEVHDPGPIFIEILD